MVPGSNFCLAKVLMSDFKPAVYITIVKLMWWYQVEPNYVGLQLRNLLVSIYGWIWTNTVSLTARSELFCLYKLYV